MATLYHFPLSSASRFARLLLNEYKQAFEPHEELYWDRRPEFLALNPAGTVPVLHLDERGSLCGALVINEYLEETAGAMERDHRLMPESAMGRAEVRRLVEWFLIKFENEVVRHLAHERVLKTMIPSTGSSAPNSDVMRAARANLKGHFQYLGLLAAQRDWLAGERLSCADLAAAAAFSVLDYMGEIHWDDEPAAREWYQRVKSRPSFRNILSDRMRSLPPSSHYADLDF